MATAKVNEESMDFKALELRAAQIQFDGGTLIDGTSMAMAIGNGEAVAYTNTSTSTSGSSSVQPFSVQNTMSGVGGVGGRSYFKLDTNVALGGWSNALKAEVVYGTAGRTAGLGSAILAEMQLSAGTSSGSYAPLEIELGMSVNAVTGTRTSLMSLNVYGHATGKGRFDDSGYVFDLNGVTAGAAHVFRTGLTAGTINAATTAALRIKIDAVDYFIPIATATA